MADAANETTSEPGSEQQEGRLARRRNNTRSKLLQAAHDVMTEVGVDAAKIKDITDRADVGFGTFYNYFESKDDIAAQVLDCIIHDYARRNTIATKGLAKTDPAVVTTTCIRLVIREATNTAIWRWWALRPDLLIDRLRYGFSAPAHRDIRHGIRRGFLKLRESEIEQAWTLACWIMVGGIHDIAVGSQPRDGERFVAMSIARAWGFDRDEADRVSSAALPDYGSSKMDWWFKLSIAADHK